VASTTFVRTRVHGAVAELQLDRAEALNSMTPEMMNAIAGELEAIDAAPAVRAAVIAGHDRAFVAGSDIRLLRERPFDAVLTQAGVKFWTRLAAIDVPLIAAVSGFALGGGCELALACDMIVASETAVFAQAEIRIYRPHDTPTLASRSQRCGELHNEQAATLGSGNQRGQVVVRAPPRHRHPFELLGAVIEGATDHAIVLT
jgi:enoyl-CoA hydratase/carnithine racemase